MPVTFNCQQVGRLSLWNKSAFEGCLVTIDNPYKTLPNKVFCSIQTFRTKKLAIEFCRRWRVTQSFILKVESRFQYGWAVGLGHSKYLPEHAEGRLFAHSMGCVVVSIENETMWLAS